ncbi:MAG: circularly permuted type 2 ATP-grasp protein [Geminicoccaceae bacterium]
MFNEMRNDDGSVRDAYVGYQGWLEKIDPSDLKHKQEAADLLFRRLGITFTVYSDSGGTERLIPFDVVPRVLTAEEWARLSAGLIQRVTALNAFLHDVYHNQEILKAGIVPSEMVLQHDAFRPEIVGIDPPGATYASIAGIDIVRVGPDRFYVLEDNLRVPSGVSYMLENREAMMRLFPDLFRRNRIAPVQHYPNELLSTLRAMAPAGVDQPTVGVLTPGIYNSAYFEHAYLAEQMGVELVEGQDLFVEDNRVYMRTTMGPKRIDVVYRRVDDDFLDPTVFRKDSVLGVPGLVDVLRKGGLGMANFIGTGVADDKAIYTYVPDMVRFYLGEEPKLENVPTYRLDREDDLAYTLEHLDELVVKEVQGSGGYGMLVGPSATKAEVEAYRSRILADPAAFIAQPTLALSTCPTFVEAGIAPRHVDLRPFLLTANGQTRVVPGGLTRVALREGSLVVNSSQGGGTKDTWVLEA